MKNRKRKFPSFIVVTIILILIVFATYKYIEFNLNSVNINDSQITIFEVKDGSSTTAVLQKLDEEGLIRDINVAKLYLKLNPSSIKAGNYELSKNMNVATILSYLSNSDNAVINDVNITFVEGDWFKDIAKKLSDNTDLNYQDIIDYGSNQEILKSLIAKYDVLTEEILSSDIRYPLEGYLFPNTYTFYKDTTIEVAIGKMLNETNNVYLENKDAFDNSELSIPEIFTLSSIVQYEASKEEDMKDIAGVFYNRLSINMPLQSSVTVCYAIDFDKDTDTWQKCETNPDYDSLYNTYKYRGLPPGPILNPGKTAILSTLNPNNNDYLYFMADVYGDGTVYFAKTYDEQINNVNKYLK